MIQRAVFVVLSLTLLESMGVVLGALCGAAAWPGAWFRPLKGTSQCLPARSRSLG